MYGIYSTLYKSIYTFIIKMAQMSRAFFFFLPSHSLRLCSKLMQTFRIDSQIDEGRCLQQRPKKAANVIRVKGNLKRADGVCACENDSIFNIHNIVRRWCYDVEMSFHCLSLIFTDEVLSQIIFFLLEQRVVQP